ncbi:MAG TPA: hypothetical protein VEZ55_02550 [Chitinophagaceae bacterium]|nr:hypothetical protein [Chitinophagaceae bacterium]
MVDTWMFHYESIEARELIAQDPIGFLKTNFSNSYENGYGKFLSSHQSWWNNLHNNAFITLLSLFNFLSFGNYYVNLIFYSFITLFGPVGLYRLMRDVFPQNKIPILLATFLFPSFIYWTSGIHKDGLIFLSFILIIYPLYFGLKTSFNAKKLLSLLGGLILLLVLRNYLLIIILPAALAWIAAYKIKKRPLGVFVSCYMAFITLFFVTRYFIPQLDFPAAVAEKQKSFLQLQGGSAVAVSELRPNIRSFVANTPEAFSISFLRPYPSDVRHLLSLAAAIEIMLLICLFLVFLVWHKSSSNRPFLLFGLFFTLSGMLTIGYTVNFIGAVVRYRSIVLPFVVVPMVAMINWSSLTELASSIKTKNNVKNISGL